MKAYVEFEILEGAYEISCPDAQCPNQGVMDIDRDILKLVSNDLVEKHRRFRLNRGTYVYKYHQFSSAQTIRPKLDG